jgi:hypothetical protein
MSMFWYERCRSDGSPARFRAVGNLGFAGASCGGAVVLLDSGNS